MNVSTQRQTRPAARLNSPLPLFFELAMETIYPAISEGAGSALLSLLITVVQIVYLAISFIPPLAANTAWMNWCLCSLPPSPNPDSQPQPQPRAAAAPPAVKRAGGRRLMIGITPACGLPLLLMRAEYNRLSVDAGAATIRLGCLDKLGCF
jgi:hypothetical protein